MKLHILIWAHDTTTISYNTLSNYMEDYEKDEMQGFKMKDPLLEKARGFVETNNYWAGEIFQEYMHIHTDYFHGYLYMQSYLK